VAWQRANHKKHLVTLMLFSLPNSDRVQADSDMTQVGAAAIPICRNKGEWRGDGRTGHSRF